MKTLFVKVFEIQSTMLNLCLIPQPLRWRGSNTNKSINVKKFPTPVNENLIIVTKYLNV